MELYQPAASRSVASMRVPQRTRRTPAPRPSHRCVAIRLFLPLTPIFLVLSPLALFAALLCEPIALLWRINPLALALGVGRVLLALGGTEVDINTRDAFVRLRIF